MVEKRYSFGGYDYDTEYEVIRGLWREQFILRKVRHPNIIKFVGFNFDSKLNQATLYMEYWGHDLRPFVKSNKPLESIPINKRPRSVNPIHLWSMLFDLASALAYCHHGICPSHDGYVVKAPWTEVLHRDIKPDNGNYGPNHSFGGTRLIISNSAMDARQNWTMGCKTLRPWAC